MGEGIVKSNYVSSIISHYQLSPSMPPTKFHDNPLLLTLNQINHSSPTITQNISSSSSTRQPESPVPSTSTHKRQIQGCCNIQDGVLQTLHLRCCSSSRSASVYNHTKYSHLGMPFDIVLTVSIAMWENLYSKSHTFLWQTRSRKVGNFEIKFFQRVCAC